MGPNFFQRKHLLAIPVFNEQQHLTGVLADARRFIHHILVVDDGSTDATPGLLKKEPGIAVVRHRQNCGYGASLVSAFRYAVKEGFEWLITMDCDEQHEPSLIPAFVAGAAKDDCDILSGSRYLVPSADDDAPPADRRAINARITRILNERLGLGITDAFCGFKAYRTSAMKELDITIPGYAMPLQLWVQAWRAGLRIREIPVRLIYHDPTRHFGGHLDDPTLRYKHYLEVLEAELSAETKTECVPSPSDCGATAA
ncbi:MAG: glycosyltransferase family 2 protein [Planctomycetes bacterium]|nr:glycosyltransferase family 2 protein [Planctomycetota bacterium]